MHSNESNRSSSTGHNNSNSASYNPKQHFFNQPQQHSHEELRIWAEPQISSFPINFKNYSDFGSRPLPSQMGVKFVNSTPDSLGDQIKREELEPKKKRLRTTPEQFRILNKEFLLNQTPNATARAVLAKKVAMSTRAVQVWFQNRRAKAKVETKKPEFDRLSSKQIDQDFYSGAGHRRAYSHNSVYHYPSKLDQTFYNSGNGGKLDEELSDSNEYPHDDDHKPSFPLGDYVGGSNGLFLDPNEMVLLSPLVESQQKKSAHPHRNNNNHSSVMFRNHFAKPSPHTFQGNRYVGGHSPNMHLSENEDSIYHQQRFSPFDTMGLDEEFYGTGAQLSGNPDLNRTNSLPMVTEFGSNIPEVPSNIRSLVPDPMATTLQDPNPSPYMPTMMYNYCNAFSPLTTGTNDGNSINTQSFYHSPPPQVLVPFSHTAGGTGEPSLQKRSFSLPCVRPDLLQQSESNQASMAEDEELLLGLGTQIINDEAEGRGTRSNSTSIGPSFSHLQL